MQITEIFHEPVRLADTSGSRWKHQVGSNAELRKQQGLLSPVLDSLARHFLGYFFIFFLPSDTLNISLFISNPSSSSCQSDHVSTHTDSN